MSQGGKPVVMKIAVDATAAIDLINDEAARLRAPVAPAVPKDTQEYTLRAMGRNYSGGHSWDRLDTECVTAAADEIRVLRAALASAPVAAQQPAAAPRAQDAPALQYHILKTDPAVFQAVLSGAKTFEIRLNDRGFAVGDVLGLRETKHTGAEMRAGAPLEYTGRECQRFVSHVLTGYGLAEGWCCLSFKLPHAGGESAPVAGEAQPLGYVLKGREWPNQCYYPSSHKPTDIHNWTPVFDHAAPQASAEPQQYTHSEVFGPMESAWNAALDQAAAVAKRISDKYAFGHYGNETDTADEIEREILALKQPQADKDGGQQLRWRVTDDMRYAVRFAPSSAHWSERLKEFFGPDAREGIDALERQLREAHAMLDRQPKLRADASAVRRALIAASNYIDTLGGDSKSYRAALYAPQAEQGERDA
ncbi:hypothetical protein BIZ92_24280 [Achromobacter xylosoxidans]|uniref:DUF3850 domain-containing protein n=2 Tax=Alcaligenes xylosoxydans xylosoxydans TaxID=85698 RepID=A0A1R1JVJ5_ALCXX|nr:hypothetical protein BIZ92_24280 [Achromobacter xylosoxidans]